jgi:hypothetical protein
MTEARYQLGMLRDDKRGKSLACIGGISSWSKLLHRPIPPSGVLYATVYGRTRPPD